MRTAAFSGLAAIAALVLSGSAALAQVKFISIGQGGHARSADHGPGFRPVSTGTRAAVPSGIGRIAHRDDRPGHWHGGGHRRPIYRPTGFYPFERFDSNPPPAITVGARDGGSDDGLAGIRALFEGPLAAGATAAGTYILLTQGPKAFGLEDDYRKAMQSLPAARRSAPARRISTGPKIIRIGE